MRHILVVLLVFVFSLAGLVNRVDADHQPDSSTGFREIIDLGCHTSNGECFVILSGDNFGELTDHIECLGNQARWDSLKQKNGRTALALLMSAWVSGKRVSIHIDGCFNRASGPTGWPTFTWLHVRDPIHVP